MQGSKPCALPLGDSPKRWILGFEPRAFRATIWRANQLRYTHHIWDKASSISNVLEGIRTPDPRLRRPLLYPAELRTHSTKAICFVMQVNFNKWITHWSGWWESNPRIQLGRLVFYHWTTPAYNAMKTILESGWQDSNLRPPGPKPGALAKLSHTPATRFHFIISHSDEIYYILLLWLCQYFF